MGTNYYAEGTHIGKSSAGWLFLFHKTDTFTDWSSVKELLKGKRIENENGEEVSYGDFVAMVEEIQKDPECIDNPENYKWGVENIDGYRFLEGDFV